MRAADFDYVLPPELIAQAPEPRRDQSRLLVVNRQTQKIAPRQFVDLAEYFSEGDVLVLNDSRVIPARLRGKNFLTGGQFEMLLFDEVAPNRWWAMMRPARRARDGTRIQILDKNKQPSGYEAVVEQSSEQGHRLLRFLGPQNIISAIETLGETPLPPYIERETDESVDRDRYQTIYARSAGSVAAPTAGLHFTEDLLANLRARGVKICFVTLHVGLGTFAPVKAENVEEHVMHEERYVLSAETAEIIAEAKRTGHRVFAGGTTTLRVLESATQPGPGRTRIYIYPPYKFKTVDALVTNFHLPRSTLLMLVSAFAAPGETRGREFMLKVYGQAVAQRFRFFSYGDAMLIL